MQITRTHVAFAASLLFNVVGIPGLVDDAKTWAGWLGMSAPDLHWVNYLLVVLGGLAFLYAIFPTIQKLTRLVAGQKAFAASARSIGHSRTMGRATGEASPRLVDWPEFGEIPLKYAACMWHGLPPTAASLQKPVVQEELARLALAVKQRKMEHRNGDAYHMMVALMNADPSHDQFSKWAMVRYAKAAGRDIPTFLRTIENGPCDAR